MALNTIPLPYGLRDLKVTPYTDFTRTAFAASSIDLPNAQTFTFTETEAFTDLRGDDQLQTSHGQGPVLEWDLENGALSMEAYAAIAGGTVTTSGVSPNQKKRYTKSALDVRPFFKIEGQAISDSGGDVHCLVYACRATKDIKGEWKDGAFMVPASSGVSYGCKVTGQTPDIFNSLYDFVQNETAVTIS